MLTGSKATEVAAIELRDRFRAQIRERTAVRTGMTGMTAGRVAGRPPGRAGDLRELRPLRRAVHPAGTRRPVPRPAGPTDEDDGRGMLVWPTLVTGMRRGELPASRRAHVDLTAGQLAEHKKRIARTSDTLRPRSTTTPSCGPTGHNHRAAGRWRQSSLRRLAHTVRASAREHPNVRAASPGPVRAGVDDDGCGPAGEVVGPTSTCTVVGSWACQLCPPRHQAVLCRRGDRVHLMNHHRSRRARWPSAAAVSGRWCTVRSP